MLTVAGSNRRERGFGPRTPELEPVSEQVGGGTRSDTSTARFSR